MINFFKKKSKESSEDDISILSVASLLIHAAKIDENYSEKEKEIVKETLSNLGAERNDLDKIIDEAEELEKNSNQILEFTKNAKNLKEEQKIILVEALWSIIYSDNNADLYESNLMRRLCGLLYLDNKVVGSIKEKIKNKKQ
jgi:uncharacterized tellurite resistance protein B-like protein|tara:strand:- start:306 stop:731 length:426 start_codon:yes stop_codon:yes gene_type:complete